MKRLEPLDWLRGLLASSIMIYHLVGWTLYEPDSSQVLGRLGVYGVSMFFILSGLSMAAAYHVFFSGVRSIVQFYVRRIFRIWPLMWGAVGVLTIGGVLLKEQTVNWSLVLLNLTTLFGFVSPGAYIATGAWSIGNEMVYYALTPAIIAVFNRNTRLGNGLLAIAIAIGLYFGIDAITRAETLAEQWLTYINPLNNLMFYLAGVAIFYNARTLQWSNVAAYAAIAGGSAVLVFFPADGDLVNVVTGLERVVFFLATTCVVLGFFKLEPTLPAWLSAPFASLGAATYGVYLLHPIVFAGLELGIGRTGIELSSLELCAATVVLTITVSILCYRWFELPLIRLGKRLSAPPPAATVVASAP